MKVSILQWKVQLMQGLIQMYGLRQIYEKNMTVSTDGSDQFRVLSASDMHTNTQAAST